MLRVRTVALLGVVAFAIMLGNLAMGFMEGALVEGGVELTFDVKCFQPTLLALGGRLKLPSDLSQARGR